MSGSVRPSSPRKLAWEVRHGWRTERLDAVEAALDIGLDLGP
jgi:hypothetical protein